MEGILPDDVEQGWVGELRGGMRARDRALEGLSRDSTNRTAYLLPGRPAHQTHTSSVTYYLTL
jgi:hypothetical protein